MLLKRIMFNKGTRIVQEEANAKKPKELFLAFALENREKIVNKNIETDQPKQ